MAYLLLNFLNLMYLVLSLPNYDTYKFEIFNEAFSLIISYTLIAFTDFIESSDLKQTAGYAIILLFVFNFLTNFIGLLIRSLITVHIIVKHWQLKRKVKFH